MEHKKGKCPCGCKEFREASRLAFVIYDPRHTFAARAAESGMPLGTLAKILGHSDLRSVMKYVHVGQEAQDRAIEQFEAHEAGQNIRQRNVRPGFRPVDTGKNRDFAGSGGIRKEGVNDGKIN